MTDQTADKTDATDYSQTLFLPQTEFPMRAGLPQREPELLARWARIDLYRKLREAGKGRDRFVLHDGPPYANGNIHIGHALNKVLKDLVTRSQQMLGFDSNYVPGWDCHGLPIEWKIEEQYRAKGLNKDDVPVVEFRKECRSFAEHWVSVQREEFKRLGVEGDWDDPYLTMAYPAEAQIAREIMKFAETGQLYRGSKPVMWSVVEKTALAEAEVEYEEHVSDTVFVAFPVKKALGLGPVADELLGASVVIWTTTPWTMPGNRAISYNHKIAYGLYRVTAAPENNWAKVGATYVLAKNLAESVFKAAKAEASNWSRSGSGRTLSGGMRPPPARARLRLRRSPARRRPRHRRRRHRLRPHRARPWPRGLRRLDEQWPPARRARHRDPHPLHRRCRWPLHQGCAGLRGRAGHHRQGREGQRQRGRHQGARRKRQPRRARPPQAPVSA